MVSANLHENVKYRSAPRSSGTSARTRIWRFARSRIFSARVRVFKTDQLPVQNNELQDICSHHITNMALTFLQRLGCFGQAMQKWASGEVSRCHNQGVTYILIIFRIFCNKKGEFVDNYHQTQVPKRVPLPVCDKCPNCSKVWLCRVLPLRRGEILLHWFGTSKGGGANRKTSFSTKICHEVGGGDNPLFFVPL